MDKTIIYLKSVFLISILLFLGCKKEQIQIESHLDTIVWNKYYFTEIVPDNYLDIYGKWELFKISGGIGGDGYEPDFEYFEIKNIGIYGLIRNDSLFEYGKFELDTFDIRTSDFLQINMIPEYYKDFNPRFHSEEYIDLIDADTMEFFLPILDGYKYHFKRIY